MQDRSKRNPNRNKYHTKYSASTTYNNKSLRTLPLRPPACNKSHLLEPNTKKLIPCPLPIKKLGKREEIPKKMRNFVGAFDCIDKLKLAPRQPFEQ